MLSESEGKEDCTKLESTLLYYEIEILPRVQHADVCLLERVTSSEVTGAGSAPPLMSLLEGKAWKGVLGC